MGKGDTYRPVDQKVYGENFDRIFRSTGEKNRDLFKKLGETHATTPNETPKPAVEQAAHNGDPHSEDLQRSLLDRHGGREENPALWAEWHGEDHARSDGSQSDIHRT